MHTWPCIKCNTEIALIEYDSLVGLYPMDGTEFISYGNYGSTVHDPMNGSTMHIVICNDCLSQVQSRTKVEPKR